jgi:hypothetical protein
MQNCFEVDHLDVERLLVEWRWLCNKPMVLVAKNAFADLFLRDELGHIHRLDVAVGTLRKVADSEMQFREMALKRENQEKWFAIANEKAAAARGLEPNEVQCIGVSVRLVYAESGSRDTPHVVDLYEHVSFLGDLNRQIAGLADGAKVRLRIGSSR